MNCPNCNTPNEATAKYCKQCGNPLSDNPNQGDTFSISNARDHLFSATFRIVISLIGLWLVNTILVSLKYVKELQIPQLPFPVSVLITLIVMLFIFFLLLHYAQEVAQLWKVGFPGAREASNVWIALITIILLNVAYQVLKPIVQLISTDNVPTMILQIAFLLVAIVVVFRVVIVIYKIIPTWYFRIKNAWNRIDKEIQQ
jgi:hypothetical protein